MDYFSYSWKHRHHWLRLPMPYAYTKGLINGTKLQHAELEIFNALPLPALLVGSGSLEILQANAAFNSYADQAVSVIDGTCLFEVFPFRGLEALAIESVKIFLKAADNSQFRLSGIAGDGFFASSQLQASRVSDGNLLLLFSQAITPAAVGQRDILDSSPDVICTIDEQGNFISVSAASNQIWGYEPHELIGTPYMSLVLPEDHALTNEIAAQIMSGAEITNFENRYHRKDGSVVPIVWSARWDSLQKVMHCVARNATAKQEVEKAVLFERQRYADLFMQAPGFICILKGPQHIYEMANPAYEKLIGVSGIVGKPISEVIPEEGAKAFIEQLDHIYQTGETFIGHEVNMSIKRQGHDFVTPYYLDLSYQPYRNEKNEIEGIFIFGNDVTAQVVALKKLEEINQRYRYVSQATSDAIWDWDLTDNSIVWGEGFQLLFGYPLAQLKPDISSWTDNLHPEDMARVSRSIDAVLQSRETNWAEEYRYLKADGSYAYVIDKGFVIREENGKAVRMVGAIRDISSRKQHEQELRQSEARMKGILESQTNYLVRRSLINSKDTYYNQKFLDDFGWLYEHDEMKGTDNMLAIMHYHHDQVIAAVKTCLGSPDTVRQVEVDMPGRDGSIRTTLWELICLTDLDGKPAELQCVGIDISGRKQAEQALVDALKEKNTILESIGDAFFAVDGNWTVSYWNKKAEKALGFSKDKIIGKNFWDVLPQAIGSVSYRKYHKAIKSGRPVHFEDYFQAYNKWFEISAYPSGGRLSVYLKDVSERKIAEQALRNAYEEKMTILDSIDDGFFAINNDAIVTYFNKKAEEWLKTKREDIVGKNLHEMFTNPGSIGFYNQYQKAMREQSTVHFEEFSSRANKWFGVSAFASEQGLSVYFKDVTERKTSEIRLTEMNEDIRKKAKDLEVSNTELKKVVRERDVAMEELLESRKSYSNLFHLSPQPMWVYDLENLRFLNVNDAAVRHYGYSREEFLAMTIKDIRPAAELPKLEEALKHANKPGQQFSKGLYLHHKKNGEIIHVEVQSNTFAFNNRRARLILANDVTDAIRYLDAIEEQNRKLQDIAYTQSHIVRAPLARMLGILNVVNETKMTDSEHWEWMGYMAASLQELDEVIKDIVQKTEQINIEQIKEPEKS